MISQQCPAADVANAPPQRASVMFSGIRMDIHNMFLSKYQYLEQHQASGPRWELQVEVNKRKLRELLGKEAYLRLDKAGLIGQWFGITQEK